MGAKNNQGGFTVAEMVVALVVISVFTTLFFQLYITNESQRVLVIRLAAANDIANSNLHKLSTKADAVAAIAPATCDSTNSAANTNNQFFNSSAAGTVAPWVPTVREEESVTNTGLPATGTTQELRVVFPRGCDALAPVKIISTVSFGSETVTRATTIN